MGAAGAQGPPVRNIHIQIPPADLYTFPDRISWENLIKYQSIFPLMVILSILTAFLDRPFHCFFFNICHGHVTEDPSTPLKRAP